MAPRWRKVLADIWNNKARSILMVLTITVGVFAVGFITGIADITINGMDSDFSSANGHSGVIYCSPFLDDLLVSLRRVPGVADVEGRSSVESRVIVDDNNKPAIEILGIPAPKNMKIDRLTPVSMAELPTLKDHEVWIASSSLDAVKTKIGDTVRIEMTGGRIRELKVTAIVHDVYAIPASFGSSVMAYVTPATIEWLGGTREYNQVFFTVSELRTDKPHVSKIAVDLSDKIKAGGQTVYGSFVYNPGRHFAKDIFQAITAILAILGVLVVFLSTFLVINIINSLLNQHIRAIGIMKSIGGNQGQILAMYLIFILCFGLGALAISVWPSAYAAYAVSAGMGAWLNYLVGPFRISPTAIYLQTGIALIIPVAAASFPLFKGTRVSIREALSNYGLANGHYGKNWIDKLMEKVSVLPRPVLISFRNTIRRKSRLILTLSTLILAGSIFIAVFNLWQALDKVIVEVEGYFLADVNVAFNREYRLSAVKSLIAGVPGVTGIEGWAFQQADLLSPEKTDKTNIAIYAPPSDSKLIAPVIKAGRWLVPGDENAIVIGNHLLKERPDLKVGDTVTTKINNQEFIWRIVGIFKLAGNESPPMVYTNYEYLSKIMDRTDRVSSIRVLTAPHDLATQQRVSAQIESIFKQKGIEVSNIRVGQIWRAQQTGQFDVMIYFLLVMVIMIAIVGGLGLMGTMSMNVMERSREIGVMRSIGATNLSVILLVLVEGLFIGVISWIAALFLSIPITSVLDTQVGTSVLNVPLDFAFNPSGVWIWLAGILTLSTLASILPALNAMRLTIREVLAYE